MELGTGIAIAGVWMFAGIFCSSDRASSSGVYLAIIVAAAATAFLR